LLLSVVQLAQSSDVGLNGGARSGDPRRRMSRIPLLNEPPLLDVERALRLAEDASELARRPLEERDRRRARLAFAVIGDAALMALETALDTGDPRVLAAALELAEEAPHELDRWERAFVDAADELLPDIASIDNRVRECARSKSERLRASTATALGPRALRAFRGEGDETDEEARRMLVELAEDPTPSVRAAAREALSGAAPPAWDALFDRDPLAARSAAEAVRLRAPLDRAAVALERGVRREGAAFAAAIAELPDELAGPLLDAWIRVPRAALAAEAEALIDRWLALDPDGARVEALVASADEDEIDHRLGPQIGAALQKQPHALTTCMRVARWMRPRDFAEQLAAIDLGKEILESGWPEDAAPTPLLELALGAPLARAAAEHAPAGDEDDLTRFTLLSTSISRPSLALLLDTLIEVLAAGCPGRWAPNNHVLRERLVNMAHPRLRALAEAWLHDEPERAGWALCHLIAGGHDPEHDPPPAALLAAAAVDPRLRPTMYAHAALRRGAAEPLRAQLAKGALPPGEAVELARTLLSIDQATLSNEEQAAIRVAREAIEDVEALSWAATLMPPHADAWTAEDQAFIERLIDAHGSDAAVTVRVALTLEKRGPDPALAALCERLLPVCYSDQLGLVKRALAVCRGERESIWTGR